MAWLTRAESTPPSMNHVRDSVERAGGHRFSDPPPHLPAGGGVRKEMGPQDGWRPSQELWNFILLASRKPGGPGG